MCSINAIIKGNSKQYGEKTALVDKYASISFQDVYEQTMMLQKKIQKLNFQRGQVIACELKKTIESTLLYFALMGLELPVLVVSEREKSNFDYAYFITFCEKADYELIGKIDIRDRELFVYQNVNYASLLFPGMVYVNCTSGTTGGKKYGMTTWKALVTNTIGICEALSFQAGKAFMCLFPTFMHFHESVMRPLLMGGVAVLGDVENLSECVELVCRNRVTHLMGTPAQIIQISTCINKAESNLELLEVGGGPLSPMMKTMLEDAFGCTVGRVWGSTETTGCCIVDLNSSEDNLLGKPVKGYSVFVYDRESRTEVPVGTGLMVIKGDGLVSNIFDGDEKKQVNGSLKMNDIVKIDDDGKIFFLGREGNMIKCAGNNIYPEVIRNVINKHPDIIDSVVFPLKDEAMGEIPAAYVVSGKKVDFFALRKHCMKSLPNWMLPKQIIVSESMPVNASGKVDMKAVKQSFEKEKA